MADPSQTTRLVVQLGDGGTPTETFAFMCGSNNWTISLSNNTNDVVTLDCTSPLDVMPTVTRSVTSQDMDIKIDGVIAKESLATWRAWADDGSTKNIKVLFDEAGVDGGGYWIVPAILTAFEVSKSEGNTVTFSATIQANGKRVWTDAA